MASVDGASSLPSISVTSIRTTGGPSVFIIFLLDCKYSSPSGLSRPELAQVWLLYYYFSQEPTQTLFFFCGEFVTLLDRFLYISGPKSELVFDGGTAHVSAGAGHDTFIR